jgi:hypothetical protein
MTANKYQPILAFYHKFPNTDVVLDVCTDLPAWPGRDLLDDGEKRRYFGLKTDSRGIVEFECRNQREYDIWTQGVSKLLSIVSQNKYNN